MGCAIADSVPDPIDFSGTTFQYTTFDNMNAPIAGVTVMTVDGISTTSNSSGSYNLSIPTGGMPRPISVTYSAASYMPSILTIDRPIDRDIVGSAQPLWQLGDAPLWSTSATSSVYQAFGETMIGGKGTVNVALRTCDGAIVTGAVVTTNALVGAIGYTGPNGVPAAGASQGPFAHAILFNVDPGPATISVNAAGLTFRDLEIDVRSDTNNLAVMHGY